MHLGVHVDDIFAVGKKERCDQFGKDLGRLVPVKLLAELKWYSEWYYERDREAGKLTTSQQTYTEELGEVWRGMGQRYSDSYNLKALGF